MEHRPIVERGTRARIARKPMSSRLLANVLTSNRYVLGLALILAWVLPEILHPMVEHLGRWFARSADEFEIAGIGVAFAVVSGHVCLQRLGLLPLVSKKHLILPTFLTTFGCALLVLLALKMPIGRYHFWTGFIAANFWYFLVSRLRSKHLRPLIGIIGIEANELLDLPGNVQWTRLSQPRLHRHVDAVVIDPHASLSLDWSRFITKLVLHGVPVYHRSHIQEGLSGRVKFEQHADNDFGSLLPSLAYLKIKRGLDLVGVAILAIPATLILSVAIIVIKLDSRGPAFFVQTRMGHRGRAFTCYKLRTMRIDCDGPAFTLENDPRITRSGKLLRKWRIDEMPQIYNVLVGDMSWIGPRPEALELAKDYAKHIPFYDYRHAVRPGISGWAAVHQGNVGAVEAAREKLEYDFFYIRHFSLWLDLLILFKTVQTLWSGSGSR